MAVGKGNMLPLELVAAYAALFVQCWDAYAVQQADGSYWRVAEPLSLSRLAAHLAGRWTLGTYLLDQESQCSFAVFDADSSDGLAQLIDLAEALRRCDIPTLLEASRRGGHLWVHFCASAPAQVIRAWLLPYAAAASCGALSQTGYVGTWWVGVADAVAAGSASAKSRLVSFSHSVGLRGLDSGR